MTWVEFELEAPAALHDRVLIDVVASLPGAGFFLRKDNAVAVQVQDPGEEIRARLRTAGFKESSSPAGDPVTGPVFGGEHLAPVTRRFLSEVSPALLDLLRASTANRSDRLAAALDLMAAHLMAVSGALRIDGIPPEVPLGFLSFRSHAEAFFATSANPGLTRVRMDERFEANRSAIQDRILAVFQQLKGEGPEVSAEAGAWYGAARDTKPVIAEHIRTGGITADTAYVDDHLRERDDFADSAFHTAAGSSTELQRFLRHDPAFLAGRLLTSMLYLSLHGMGVTLVERYFLCHAMSRACELIFEVDAMAVLGKIADHGV
ncbi:lantibiotic dehydratase C-terminal domain-containing protein [Nonomuraea sp. NPDC049400]|uniref:lantibiotic dehydratase C-terminal domain-containing protein n=1 Tax=Nonomuraea sp. NPDC049400 TaxID=3364352 RepID=UPI0037941C52